MAKLEWDDALAIGQKPLSADDLDDLMKDFGADLEENIEAETPPEAPNIEDVLADDVDLGDYLTTEEVKPTLEIRPITDPKAEPKVIEREPLLSLDDLTAVTEKTKEPAVTEEPAVDKKEVKKAEPKKPEPKKAESAEEQTKAEEQKKPKAEEPVKNLTQWENSPSRCPVCGAKMSEKYCPVCRHRSGEETLLESKEGMKKFVKITEIQVKDAPMPCNRNVVRFVDGKYELIGMATVPVEVIDVTETEASLLRIDHALKVKGVSGDDRKMSLEYELEHEDEVKKLFGKGVAELNDMSEAELLGMDERLAGLENIDKLTTLPKEVLEILAGIVKDTGIKAVPDRAIDELKVLQDVSERNILMILLKGVA